MKKIDNANESLFFKKIRKSFLKNSLVAVLFLFCGTVFNPGLYAAYDDMTSDQRQVQVTGKITDAATGQGMPGVNIQVKGSTLGAISDMDGRYTLSVPDANTTLVFSFIGYVTQEIALGGRTGIDVALAEELTKLEEVVVVGYGTQKKATVTGSISQVNAENLRASSTINFTNSFAGRLPGLVVVTRSGEPGNDNSTLRIRGLNTLGDNSPLIVIDGIANRSMQRLNPG